MNNRVFALSHMYRQFAKRRVLFGIGAAILVSTLAACGGSGSEPTVTPALTPTWTAIPPTPTPIPPPVVGEIVWTTSVQVGTNAPGKSVESIEPATPVIFAVIRVANLPSGAVLSAAWSYNDVPLEDVSTGVVSPANYLGGFVEFHIAKSDEEAWPTGTYVINVLLNGDTVQVSQIEVVTP